MAKEILYTSVFFLVFFQLFTEEDLQIWEFELNSNTLSYYYYTITFRYKLIFFVEYEI